MLVIVALLFAGVIIVLLPLRGWFRYRRGAAPTSTPIYLLETSTLAAVLLWLLHMGGVSAEMVGVHSILTIRFLVNVIICTAVVVGLDILSVRFARAQMKVQENALRLAAPQSAGVYTDALLGRQRLHAFLPVVLVGAAWEELCFRGALFSVVPRNSMPLVVGAVILGSVCFGSQHFRNGPLAVGYSTFYGILFSCLYLATRDLIAIAIAHAAGNTVAAVYGAPQIARVREEAMTRPSIFLG